MKIFHQIAALSLIFIFNVHALEISRVDVSPEQINPTANEKVKISFYLDTDAEVKIRFYDADNYIVNEINRPCFTGMNFFDWDGKDKNGNTVPDDAYYFTIESKNVAGAVFIYDPADFSGGENIFVPVPVNFGTKYNIDYSLTKNARVRIRAGIYRAAILKNIVDWEPRLGTDNSEQWDGKDKSGLIIVPDLDKYSLSISAYALPDHSIITKGNIQSYFEYQKNIAKLNGFNSLMERLNSPEGNEATDRARKIRGAALARPGVSINDHYMLAKSFNFAPNFNVELISGIVRMENNIPVVKGEIVVKFTLDEDSKNMLANQRYEVLCLVDDVVIGEDEEGYSPFTKFFDTKRFTNGEHFLIVNIAGLSDYVGEQSILIKVEN